MAIYKQVIVISALFSSFAGYGATCSTQATASEQRELCAGEEHPLAIKLCAESLEIERDKYGRVKSYKYKSDARIPPVNILERVCNKDLLEDQNEITDCRKTMRVKRNLDGRMVGYSYQLGEEIIDRVTEDTNQPLTGDGGYLCKEEPKDSLSRKVCIDGLNFDQDGDYMTTYYRSVISKYATDEEAQTLCKKYEKKSNEYEYCKQNVQVARLVDGSIDTALVVYPTSSAPSRVSELDAVCEKRQEGLSVEKLTAKEPEPVRSDKTSSRPAVERVPSSKNKCSGLSGDELKACIQGSTGEQTLISFKDCKAVWGARDVSPKVGEGQGSDVPDRGPGRRPKDVMAE